MVTPTLSSVRLFACELQYNELPINQVSLVCLTLVSAHFSHKWTSMKIVVCEIAAHLKQNRC